MTTLPQEAIDFAIAHEEARWLRSLEEAKRAIQLGEIERGVSFIDAVINAIRDIDP